MDKLISREFSFLLRYYKVKYPREIIWAHRVNTIGQLQKAIKSKAHFIEGDVWLQKNTPVMTHNLPTSEKSLLPLREWVKKVICAGKGVKLDFKDPKAVLPSLLILKEFKFPPQTLILNADVFKGPNAPASSFQPRKFALKCRLFFPKSFLSLGFTTVPHSSPFKECTIKKAIDFILSISPPVTLCLRVELVTEKIIKKLLQKNIIPTLWSSLDAPLGENWWRENWSRISRWHFAFMDFPDFSSLSKV